MWAKSEKAGDGVPRAAGPSGFKAESGASRLGEGRWGQGRGLSPSGPTGGEWGVWLQGGRCATSRCGKCH